MMWPVRSSALYMYNFVFVQAFFFACAQRSGWPNVCVPMYESWTGIPSDDFFLNLINQEI